MGAARSTPKLLIAANTTAATMSDEEFYEEEEVSNTSKKGDGNFLKARQEAKKGELDEQLREYINEWRKQCAKEEEELKRLKKKRRTRRRRKRRNKCETTDSQEELPNHLRNCSNYSQLSSFDCAQIFRFHSFLDIYVLFEIE